MLIGGVAEVQGGCQVSGASAHSSVCSSVLLVLCLATRFLKELAAGLRALTDDGWGCCAVVSPCLQGLTVVWRLPPVQRKVSVSGGRVNDVPEFLHKNGCQRSLKVEDIDDQRANDEVEASPTKVEDLFRHSALKELVEDVPTLIFGGDGIGLGRVCVLLGSGQRAGLKHVSPRSFSVFFATCFSVLFSCDMGAFSFVLSRHPFLLLFSPSMACVGLDCMLT